MFVDEAARVGFIPRGALPPCPAFPLS